MGAGPEGPESHAVRHPGPALRPGGGLLRVPAPALELPLWLADGGPDPLWSGRHRRVLLHPGHSGLPDGCLDLPPGPGAPPGAGGPPAAPEGRRISAGHVRPPLLPAGRGLRRRLCRRPRPAPRPEGAAGPGGPGRCPVPGHDPSLELASAPVERRRAGGRGDPGRRGVPGADPALPGVPERDRQGEAVHRLQHPLHPPGLRPGQHRGAGVPGGGDADASGPAQERRDPQEHPLVGHPAPARHLQPAPGDPDLLQVHGYRYRSVPHQRGVPAGDPVAAGALLEGSAEPDLDQRAVDVYARLRRRGGSGEPGDARGAPRVLDQGHPPRGLHRSPDLPPGALLQRAGHRLCLREDPGQGIRLPGGGPERLHHVRGTGGHPARVLLAQGCCSRRTSGTSSSSSRTT